MKSINFNKEWKFILDRDTNLFTSYGLRKGKEATGVASITYHEGFMRNVELPHDWGIELPPDARCNKGNAARAITRYVPSERCEECDAGIEDYPIGWYRKHFTVSEEDLGKRIFLEFEGVFRDFDLFINGMYIDNHKSGYTGAVMEITDHIEYGGDNVIAVRVDASQPEGWWYEGAGIYRGVKLLFADEIYIPRHTTFVKAAINGDVNVETTLINKTVREESVSVRCTVTDKNDVCVAEKAAEITLPSDKRCELKLSLFVDSPRLWDVESPELYYLTLFVNRGGKESQADKVRFGFREITFDPDHGMYLNGKHLKLYGACIHQDFGGFGVALPERIARYKIELLKSMGANSYRSAHHPASEDILNACDELGILVMDETRLFGSSAEALRQLEDMVLQHRNHPSIFLWSLGNEEYVGNLQSTEMGRRMCLTAYKRLLSLDNTREVTFSANNGAVHDGVNNLFRVRGFNYARNMDRLTHDKDGKYLPGYHADRYHREHPEIVMLGAEEGSNFSCRGVGFDDYEKGQLSSIADNTAFGGSTPEGWMKFYDKRDYLVGALMWTGIDYYGEPSPFTDKNLSSSFGAIDLVGIPKSIYHYFRSCLTDDTVLELTPHWDFELGQKVKIAAYTNCEHITLYLNGRKICEKTLERYDSVVCELDFEPGRLEAVGTRGGGTYRTHLDTPEAKYKLSLYSDAHEIKADDISIIDVKITDKNGITVASANDLVSVSVEGDGKIVGIGNGDPASFEPDKYLDTVATEEINNFRISRDGGEWEDYKIPEKDDMSEVVPVAFIDSKFRSATYEARHPDYEDDHRIRWEYSAKGEVRQSFVYEAELDGDDFSFVEFDRLLGNFTVYLNGEIIGVAATSGRQLGRQLTPYRFACRPRKGVNLLRIELSELRSRQTGIFGGVKVGKFIPAEWKRSVFYGQLRVFVKATEGDSFTLKATAEGLESAELTLMLAD